MNIALIGYGKMGREIHKIALAQGYSVPLIVGREGIQSHGESDFTTIDVAIEFSVPRVAHQNLTYLIENDVPVVCGTTGWLDQYDDICNLVKKHNGSMVYGSNFSVGVNVLFYINEKLAKIMSSHKQFKVDIAETHHIHKIDAPSGTAITLANQIIEHSEALESWDLHLDKANSIRIQATRKNEVPGTHVVSYVSDDDLLQIRHEAASRIGFAKGALLAARYIKDKKGIFSMNDVLGLG